MFAGRSPSDPERSAVPSTSLSLFSSPSAPSSVIDVVAAAAVGDVVVGFGVVVDAGGGVVGGGGLGAVVDAVVVVVKVLVVVVVGVGVVLFANVHLRLSCVVVNALDIVSTLGGVAQLCSAVEVRVRQ